MPHVFRSVFHPTSFSGSHDAFVHALRIALAARGDLRLVHVHAPHEAPNFDPFPRVRATLARWGLISGEESERAVTERTGLTVDKKLVWDASPRAGIIREFDGARVDLMVLALADRGGTPDIFQDSVAEDVVRATGGLALCVHRDAGGFVAPESGAVRLKSVLVPVSERIPPARAIDTAVSLCELLGESVPDIHLLYVGGGGRRGAGPPTDAPGRAVYRVHEATGAVVEQILAAQARLAADLICMPVMRRHGFMASVRGSIAERVLRVARCPVLLAPTD
ncbi:MAG: universal stress protein [Methylobacteriaceae bacterium]|nr:universal stress protein [Methylobacteriaceae bacterium]